MTTGDVEGSTAAGRPPARERLLSTAYELFSRRGVRAVGIDEVIEQAQVAKATLYKHFRSKDELVEAFLERREQLWTREFVEAEARRRGRTARDQLLAIFDVLDDWFHREDFEASVFINVILELGRDHRLGQASVRHLGNIRAVVASMAEEAGVERPEEFARSWHVLMQGSIISAAEGDLDAAARAKEMANHLISRFAGPA